MEQASAIGLHRRHVTAVSNSNDSKSSELLQLESAMLIAKEIKALSNYIKPPVPNAAPVALFGVGLTTALAMMKSTRLTGDTPEEMMGVDTLLIGFALFFGGLLLVIASIVEIKRNNVFGFTAFGLYGSFWMSMATINIVALVATGGPPPLNPKALQALLFIVSIMSYMFWFLTFKVNVTLNVVFFLLATTVMLLCFGVTNEAVDRAAGWFGILTAIAAFWMGFAELVNDIIGEGHPIIPMGTFSWNRYKNSGAVNVPGHIQGVRPSTVLREEQKSAVRRDVENGEQHSGDPSV